MTCSQQAASRLNTAKMILWRRDQARAWCYWRDLGMVEIAEKLWRPDMRARYPKAGDPPARGTLKEFEQADRDGLLSKVGNLYIADQVMRTFPAAAASTESRRGVPARCEAPTKKARGPVPKVMPRLIAEMRKIPRAELASMKTSEMEDHFKASHRWVIKARCTVLEDGYNSAQEEL